MTSQTIIRNKSRAVPWEGNTSGYPTVMQDGDMFKMIYRGQNPRSL